MKLTMEMIQLNGLIFRSWTGACPIDNIILRKAKLNNDGYSYHIVAFNENYPEGEDASHFNLETGERIARSDPPIGYKYEDESINSKLLEMSIEEKLYSNIITKSEAELILLNKEMKELLNIFIETQWYEERASDYHNSNGLFGKEMPIDIYKKRDNARSRISDIREILKEIEQNA